MAKVDGHTGLLSIWDTAAYKPIICLNSTSLSRTAVMQEKVNYCTQGKTESSVQSIDKTVSFEAEYNTTTAANASYEEVAKAMETKQDQFFKLEGRGEPMFFRGVISTLSDTFQAGEDASFSGEVAINETFEDDPKS